MSGPPPTSGANWRPRHSTGLLTPLRVRRLSPAATPEQRRHASGGRLAARPAPERWRARGARATCASGGRAAYEAHASGKPAHAERVRAPFPCPRICPVRSRTRDYAFHPTTRRRCHMRGLVRPAYLTLYDDAFHSPCSKLAPKRLARDAAEAATEHSSGWALRKHSKFTRTYFTGAVLEYFPCAGQTPPTCGQGWSKSASLLQNTLGASAREVLVKAMYSSRVVHVIPAQGPC